MIEYEAEATRGLPGTLPAGESILWQGAPVASPLARRAFHVRKLAVYFSLLLLWRVGTIATDGDSFQATGLSILWLALMAVAAIGILVLLAVLISRTTVYTITNARLVIRSGIALPMTINIPFRVINSAGLKSEADGSGDIPLSLIPGERISYFLLWPHARPWHIAHAEPMLRCVPDAKAVAQILAAALATAVVSAAPQPEPGKAVGSSSADLQPPATIAA